MGSIVGQNADNALQVNKVARDGAGVARQGGAAIDEVVPTTKGAKSGATLPETASDAEWRTTRIACR